MAFRNLPALSIAGKIYLCPVAPMRPCGVYVFQRVAAGRGNLPDNPRRNTQLRRWVMPADPRTPAQRAQRQRMRAAVAAWHALTPVQREAWRTAAAARRVTRFNAYVSAYLRGEN